jgi:hypothetical protein
MGFTILTDKYGVKWDEAFKSLQIEGRITSKHILEIIKLLLKREEIRENEEDRSI